MPANLPIQANGDNYEPMELDIAEPDDQANELPVLDDVGLDLATYASHYHGLVRIYRLEFIADHCRSLREEALTLALDYIKGNTCNVRDYVRLFRKLQEACRDQRMLPSANSSSSSQNNATSSTRNLGSQSNWPNNEAAGPSNARQVGSSSTGAGTRLQSDNAWIDTKTKQAALKYEKLESELKNFRANFIKENLRRAQDDLGDHYLDCGELENAWIAYNKSRDYSASHRSPINQYLNIIRVGILLKRWPSVSSYVLRASSQPAQANDQQAHPAANTQLSCAAGLYELHSKRYKKAAMHFFSTNFDHFDVKFGILAPIDIAVYGSLCALATCSRQELANNIINSATFKQFAELDPQLRDAVGKFYESKYDACLAILQEIKNNLLLDMYLAPHVDNLYRMIRNKALVQYFEPYSSACMRRMASSFTTSLGELEQEVIQLIYDGHIKARIDSHQKILFANSVDQRLKTFESAISLSKQWQRQTRALITRTAIVNANLEVPES